METHRRGADGRRLFTTPFKQEQMARIARDSARRVQPDPWR